MAENNTGKYVLIAGGLWLGWRFVLSPILEGLQLKDTPEEAAAKKLQDKVESLNISRDYWNPAFIHKAPAGYTAKILTQSDANILARKIKDAAGYFNDNEEQIYSVFRELKYKSQIAFLVYKFNVLYGLDLYTWLKESVLSAAELNTVLSIAEKLPAGYQNLTTGKII